MCFILSVNLFNVLFEQLLVVSDGVCFILFLFNVLFEQLLVVSDECVSSSL